MPPKRKRGLILKVTEDIAPSLPTPLDNIRDMEEFAALGQYLFMFGIGALKLPDFGREASLFAELETELLAPQSVLVEQIQMALIRIVTANPRLGIEQFDEQARSQFVAMKSKMNPFGEEKVVRAFRGMDLFTKIRVLHQLSIWTFIHPNRMRERMGDVDPQEELSWRMDHCGYDRNENAYYILDDNRLYRRTPLREVIALVGKKAHPKQRKGQKRRRVSTAAVEEPMVNVPTKESYQSMRWSCICITLQEWEVFVAGLKNSNDEDEKALCKYLDGEVLPEIRRAEDLRRKKLLDLEKERQKQEAMANRKRSSRIDEKTARRKEQEEKVAETRRQEEFLRKAQAEERKREKEREARLALRERQNKEREQRSQTQGVESSPTSCDGSVSGRRTSTRAQTRVSQRLQQSQPKEDRDWVFDCRCGVHGLQYEDGSKIVACDRCDIWQHLACQNLPSSFTEGDFTCERCRRREAQVQAANSPRVTIKLRIGPQNKVLPISSLQNRDGNTPSIAPVILDQPKMYSQEPRAGLLGEPIPETSLIPRGNSQRRGNVDLQSPSEKSANQCLYRSNQLKVNRATNGSDAGDGSAQASADFLLLMADPACTTPSSSQQDSETAPENPSMSNIFPKSYLSAVRHEDKYTLQKLVPVNGNLTTIPNTTTHLPSPEENTTLVPFMDNLSPTPVGPPGKIDAHSCREPSYTQNILTSSATPANV